MNDLIATIVSTEGQAPLVHLTYDVNPLTVSLYTNTSYGVLVGSKAGGKNTKMTWKLLLAPNMCNAQKWDKTAVLTMNQAIKRANETAQAIAKQERAGHIAVVRYTTKYGFQFYQAEDGGITYSLNTAKVYTYPDAYAILANAKADDFATDLPGDEIHYVTVHDSLNPNRTQPAPKHRHLVFEELLRQNAEMEKNLIDKRG